MLPGSLLKDLGEFPRILQDHGARDSNKYDAFLLRCGRQICFALQTPASAM
jgi:hypothetical protein